MAKEQKIIIKTPQYLLDNLKNIKVALERVALLNIDKNILIVDTSDNINYYKGSLCNIIESN